MRPLTQLHQQLLAQTQRIQELVEQEETQPLFKQLKRRSVLLHRMRGLAERGDATDRSIARQIVEELLAADQQIQSRITHLQKSLHVQMGTYQQQRRAVNPYRSASRHASTRLVT